MTHKEYNGWTNYETWCVKLWMDNEPGDAQFWRERATGVYENAEPNEVNTKEQAARYALEQELKSQFEENNPLAGQASMWADLITAALSEVNYLEIAEHLVDDAKEEIARR